MLFALCTNRCDTRLFDSAPYEGAWSTRGGSEGYM